jgi:U3 small nucleolar RNA-associated protein 3
MVNKIKFDVDHYEPSDSETEYNDRESKLLKKYANQQKRQNSESEQELLPFDDDNDDADGPFGEEQDESEDDIARFEADSDLEDGDGEIDDLAKGWGKDKRAYYGPNFVDNDYSTYNEKEEEMAHFEEKEAKEIQQKLAKQMDEADFSLDMFNQAVEDSDDEVQAQTKLQTDLTDLSQRQKAQLFRKEAPEFDGLVSDFQQHLTDCKDYLKPTLDFLAAKGQESHPLYVFVHTRYEIAVNYCTNVAFYLVLKAKRTPIKNHPIVRRLNQFRQLLLQLEEKYETVIKPQLERLIDDVAAGKDVEFEAAPLTLSATRSKKKTGILRNLKEVMDQATDASDDGEDDFLQEAKRFKTMADWSGSEAEGDDEPEGEQPMETEGVDKRRIPYLISKNKGLTAQKRKELRNPRVKNRNRFNKAVVRRKGAVRPVRQETSRYGGEASGIKAFVRRSIKIKS